MHCLVPKFKYRDGVDISRLDGGDFAGISVRSYCRLQVDDVDLVYNLINLPNRHVLNGMHGGLGKEGWPAFFCPYINLERAIS